ncbi:signal recognition particle-docking protein FtsY [Thioalkalivibrio sp. HK1]|uniref:signal recognition particle-docking protein FtsY n=1 Tax=Thioalkalivibrio sp. HK1 TaxID=1469245 RepID=UPI000472D281|nr:signal recognition particle-docking protein FtsY [Thioalkalivibrio sp. HK1]
MIRLFRKRSDENDSSAALKAETPKETPEEKTGFFRRLGNALRGTRQAISGGIGSLLGTRSTIDETLFEEIEDILLGADLGVNATRRIVDNIRLRSNRREIKDNQSLLAALESDMLALLEPVERPLRLDTIGPDEARSDKAATRSSPFVILVVGVNGAGKTTTIGKLSARFKGQGRSVMVAAGDTFRAAAIEQLRAWGERVDVPVIAQHTGADCASVIYDALESARARGVDVLIADTAGRLHTKSGLMDELRKVCRVIKKLEASAPHEVLLVLDAGTGQNALAQAVQFHEAVGVSGIALTKLDGTAKGGIIFAIAEELGLPIRLIGIGEGQDDLRDFEAREFVRALLEG